MLNSRVEEQVFGVAAAAVVVVRNFAAADAVLGIKVERRLKLVDNRTDANNKTIQHKRRDIVSCEICKDEFRKMSEKVVEGVATALCIA